MCDEGGAILTTKPSGDTDDDDKMREMMSLEQSLDADITRALGEEAEEEIVDHNADKKIVAVLSLANQPADADRRFGGATCSDSAGA